MRHHDIDGIIVRYGVGGNRRDVFLYLSWSIEAVLVVLVRECLVAEGRCIGGDVDIESRAV